MAARREKLVALLEEYGRARGETYIDIEAPDLADFLIANGVTLETEKS